MLDVIRDVGLYLSTVPGPIWAVASIVLMGVYRKLASNHTPKLVDYRKSLGQQILASLKTAPEQWTRTKAGELIGMNGRIRVAMRAESDGSVSCVHDKISVFINPNGPSTRHPKDTIACTSTVFAGETDLSTIVPYKYLEKIKYAVAKVHNKFAEQTSQREAANLAASLQPLPTSLPVLNGGGTADLRSGTHVLPTVPAPYGDRHGQ